MTRAAQNDAEILPNAPVISRVDEELPSELPRGAEIPGDLDPLADGILMEHQAAWLEDDSPLKIAEKGRRTGITFAEALDDTLIAAKKRSAGGDNVFYIGDTKDKGREFIGYVAHFASIIAGELHQVEEFLFEDAQKDGSTQHINAFRIRFASGFRVEALSSNPANIRGLQGVVVIDEAAFHKNVAEVLDAVNAMLVWEGKIRVISTHNGHLNPFNELIREARAGRNGFNVHHIPFSDAVENGLYERVCYVKGREWTQEAQDAWEARIRASYGARTAQMAQELDAIPAEAEGAALTRVQIEGILQPFIPFHRMTWSDEFKAKPDDLCNAEALRWCEEHLKPVLSKLNENLKHVVGEDFAVKGDATDIVVDEIGADLVSRAKLIVEMRKVDYPQQELVFKYICDRLPNFIKGAVDTTGNGDYLASRMEKRYGDRIVRVSFSRTWYAENMPPYIDAIVQKTVIRPKHADILSDHQALQWVDGIIRIPQNFRFKGSDGEYRHGDSAVAGALAHFASRQDWVEFAYTPVRPTETGRMPNGLGFVDENAGGWWNQPLGARLRGRI
ncbi:MAG: hypothetical protein AAGP08_00120 [Pseudomonadota bacterium]